MAAGLTVTVGLMGIGDSMVTADLAIAMADSMETVGSVIVMVGLTATVTDVGPGHGIHIGTTAGTATTGRSGVRTSRSAGTDTEAMVVMGTATDIRTADTGRGVAMGGTAARGVAGLPWACHPGR